MHSTQHCTAMFPASKFQSLQVTVATLNPKTGVHPDRVQQHAARLCTISAVHSSLLTSLTAQNAESPSLYDDPSAVHSKQQREQPQTWSSPQINVLNSTHTTQSMFQLVFQLRNVIPCRCTDSSHKSTMRRRHSQNCDETEMANSNDAPNIHKRTGSRVPFSLSNRSVRSIPSLPHKDNPVAQPAQPTRAVTIPRADNWLRNQLTCLGLVPRVHVVARRCCPSRRVEGAAVCARRCSLPPAVSPLGRAPCSIALPSLAGWSPPSRSAQHRWLLGEVRVRRMARRSDEYSACSRCYSTQPHSTTVEESRITRMQKGTIIKGRPPFCHHQCSRTAARPRAALPRHNVQSTTHVPTT